MGKFDNTEIQRECKTASFKITKIRNGLSEIMIGRKAKITSNYNGQSCGGRSKPSLKGKVITIKDVFIGSDSCQIWDGDINHCFIPVEEVEFIDAE